MVVHYLIAGSLRHAQLTAQIDLRWKQIGPYLFENSDGEQVKITDAESFLRDGFRGARKFTLYLGYGWWTLPRNLRAQLNELAPVREVKIVELEI